MQLTFGNTLLIQSKLKQYFFQFCFISIKAYHYKQCMYVPKKKPCSFTYHHYIQNATLSGRLEIGDVALLRVRHLLFSSQFRFSLFSLQ